MNEVNMSVNGRRVVTPSEPKCEIQTITPDMARQWLEKNSDGNRRLRVNKVAAYARDMREGRWRVTHQGIAFNRSGYLVDGQHRLHAIIESNMTVDMLVATGFGIDVAAPIDVGAARSAADLMGLSNSAVATLRCLHTLGQGALSYVKGGITAGELSETLEVERESFEWATTAVLFNKHFHAGIRFSGWCAGALAFAYPLDRDVVNGFAEQLRTGELLEAGDPAYGLRGWLARDGRATSMDIAMVTCNALRYALAHEKLLKVFTGNTGYRWLCGRRRALKLANTPTTQTIDGANPAIPFEVRKENIARWRNRRTSG